MAWEQLSINKPHLVYIILGGFTSIFMLCSLFIKEKLYIGEATVATICGVIFGPHAANLVDPQTWGNVDQITLEFSRIVLVVQCFAVGVELPKAYMERHWKSVVFLLVPVMTFGWLITSLFIWWMIIPLTWLESLVVSACVTATDPVLASSVVGKGKFAKRVPKHLRDVLSAESGCNDGMAFPFIYLSLYLVRYHLSGREVVFHWVCFSILYECVFGAFYGVMVGYIGRHMIKLAERKGLIDRESFLVFYFVLALFCAGSGSMLGMDDLLVGFAAGVGFSNDGWFTEKTEESHVSNVIDLLINLTYFVYFGTIIPWDQFNAQQFGLSPWRLVVISIFVIFFRRIPAMLALKPFIPDVKTWREALFAGHFGPIGVGAIFVAILARAELESETTVPLAKLPTTEEQNEEFLLITVIWPVVTFLVITSILVHGSSIAVFTLGKRINTLTITLSYTQDNEKGPAWMNRLPRITSQSRSMARTDSFNSEADEKMNIPPGELPPIGIPKLHLRRQREEDYDEKKPVARSSSHGRSKRKKRREKDAGKRLGGPISQSAIAPSRNSEPALIQQESGSETLYEKSGEPSPQSPQERLVTGSPTSSPERDQLEMEHEAEARKEAHRREHSPPPKDSPADVEVYDEGEDIVVEDKEGNVVETINAKDMSADEKVQAIEKARNRLTKDESGNFAKHRHESHPRNEGAEFTEDVEQAVMPKTMRHRFDQWKGFGRKKEGENDPSTSKKPERKRGPAHAYQFGNTVIVEDEDGEVIKTYTIPNEGGGGDKSREQMRAGLRRMSTWVGMGRQPAAAAGPSTAEPATADDGGEEFEEDEEPKPEPMRRISDASSDDGLRMTISHRDQYGLTGLQKKTRNVPGTIALGSGRRLSTRDFIKQMQQLDPKSKIREVEQSDAGEDIKREVRRAAKEEDLDLPITPGGGLTRRGRTELSTAERPEDEKSAEAGDYFSSQGRPRLGSTLEAHATLEEENEEEEERGIPTHNVRYSIARHGQGQTAADARRRQLAKIRSEEEEDDNEGETAAEKRRRLAALGLGAEDDSSSESDPDEEEPRRAAAAVQEPDYEPEEPSHVQPKARIQWGGESGRVREREREQPQEQAVQPEPVDIYAGDPVVSAARRLRRMMRKNKEKA